MTKGTKILLSVASAALAFLLIPSLNAKAASAGETFTNPNNGSSYQWQTNASGQLVLYKDGALDSNEFVSDGSYTYFCQADGTVMTDQLSYHPDGQHVIYFDWQGHEIFNAFTHVSKSLTGSSVDDQCYFNANGFMYTDTVTYDITGTKLYYINPNGQLEHNGWFHFDSNAGYGDSGEKWTFTTLMPVGYAQYDGSLLTSGDTYWRTRPCTMQANGERIWKVLITPDDKGVIDFSEDTEYSIDPETGRINLVWPWGISSGPEYSPKYPGFVYYNGRKNRGYDFYWRLYLQADGSVYGADAPLTGAPWTMAYDTMGSYYGYYDGTGTLRVPAETSETECENMLKNGQDPMQYTFDILSAFKNQS